MTKFINKDPRQCSGKENVTKSHMVHWRALNHINTKLFEDIYSIVGGRIQYDSSGHEEFDQYGCKGLRMTLAGEESGIQRYTRGDGDIVIGTKRNNEWHGLCVKVERNKIAVEIWQDGYFLQWVNYDKNGRYIGMWSKD